MHELFDYRNDCLWMVAETNEWRKALLKKMGANPKPDKKLKAILRTEFRAYRMAMKSMYTCFGSLSVACWNPDMIV